MKRLQIVDHNINIGHCKVYSRDFVTNILWFINIDAVRQDTFNPYWLVDFEPTTSCSGVQESTNRPPCSPFAEYELFMISRCQDMNS